VRFRTPGKAENISAQPEQVYVAQTRNY
jgi:hypothetical protein